MTVKIERIYQTQDNQTLPLDSQSVVSTPQELTPIEPSQSEPEENQRPKTSTLTLEERLKIISNLIVDRIIEDQLNGNLHFKTKQTK